MNTTQRVYADVVDKSAWPSGPWQAEPDKIQWTDPGSGLPCLIVRGPSGAWCGYVGIAEGHPLFERGYSECATAGCASEWHHECTPEGLINVHGGLTYADHCQQGPEQRAICHIPEPGQPDHVWWFGFDCAHLGDRTPKYDFHLFGDDVYRTVDYARSEVTSLAAQLAVLSVSA